MKGTLKTLVHGAMSENGLFYMPIDPHTVTMTYTRDSFSNCLSARFRAICELRAAPTSVKFVEGVGKRGPFCQFAMESLPDDVHVEHPELQTSEDFQFDPDCTLILYGLHGRNHKGLLKKFLRIGSVTFWQPVLQYDTAIVAYATPELALEAKNTITDEKVLFCTVCWPLHCFESLFPSFWAYTDPTSFDLLCFRRIPPFLPIPCYYRRECATS